MQIFDEPAVDQARRPVPRASASAWAAMTRRAQAISSRARRKSGICRFDLFRMDQGLAVETERAALPAGEGEPLVVGEIEVDAVESREPMGARGEQI